MNRHVIEISGPDSDVALTELLSQAEYEKLDCVIWVSNAPEYDVIAQSTLAYTHVTGSESESESPKEGNK